MKSYNWALIQYFLCPDKKRGLGHRQHWQKDDYVRMQWEGSHLRVEERGLVCTCSLSCVQFFATPWTIARQTPLSMGFSRQEYCSGLPCPPLGVFLTQRSNPSVFCLLHWQVGSLPRVPPGKPQREASGQANAVWSWSWISGLQNSEIINVCCLSHPVWGFLLWEPYQTNTMLFFLPGSSFKPQYTHTCYFTW